MHYDRLMTAEPLPPLRIPFADLWGMRIEHPYSLLVREGGFAWTCGQCPLSAEGAVLAPDDLAAQAEPVDGYIRHLLANAGYGPVNVGKLVAYHAVNEPAATERMLSHFREAYPAAILMPVATPFFYYPGMRLEVDVHAAERRAPLVTVRGDASGLRLQVLDAGDLVWASVEVRAMRGIVADETARTLDTDAVRDALRKGGVSAGALLADHWFVGGEGAGPAIDALALAGLVTDPEIGRAHV